MVSNSGTLIERMEKNFKDIALRNTEPELKMNIFISDRKFNSDSIIGVDG